MNIEPVAFQRNTRPPGIASRWRRGIAWGACIVVLLFMVATAGFVLSARQVTIHIEPEPDGLSISGGFAPSLAGRYLLRPGTYFVKAHKRCYEPLVQSIHVIQDNRQTINLALQPAPGYLRVRAYHAERPEQVIQDTHIEIDGQRLGAAALREITLQPGPHRVVVAAERYQSISMDVIVQGCNQQQDVEVALTPNWSGIRMQSIPSGAQVRLDGKRIGRTPLNLDLDPGTYQLAVSARRYKTWRQRLTVVANQPQLLDNIRLAPADGVLTLSTQPPAASVLADSTFAGKTPLKLSLSAGVTHVLRLSKNGYASQTLKVQVESGQNKALSTKLVPQTGIIRLHIQPADAELLVDGVSRGRGLREIQLIAVEHQLDIRKAGYESHQTRLTPKPGFPQLLRVILNKTPPTASAAVLQAGNGYRLTLIPTGTFVMGASRREQGRRSNETLRKVVLQRPFYMGLYEVTNEQFRRYTASHHSGKVDTHSLNQDQQPVAQVSWAQAAGFANWLSVKDGLPPVYMRQGETYVATDPLPIGYRLCTEAEWEYTGRYAGNNSFVKFPWGSAFPPPAKAGNFADRSAKDVVANYLERYDDTYPVSSPTGRFQANTLGIYDMGGNVAEWSHDYYAIVSSTADSVQRDPVGPKQGVHHVIKGASWKRASISALRLSYRDYGNAKRVDVGFRLCRYAKAVGDRP